MKRTGRIEAIEPPARIERPDNDECYAADFS